MKNKTFNAIIIEENDDGTFSQNIKEKKIESIKDPFFQVFQQVTKLQEEKKEMLKSVSGNFIIKIHYENLVNQPIKEIEKIQTFLNRNKIKMNLKSFKLPKFQNRNNNSFGLPILKNEFKKYYKRLENDARENSN